MEVRLLSALPNRVRSSSRASGCFARRRLGVRISPDPPQGRRLAARTPRFQRGGRRFESGRPYHSTAYPTGPISAGGVVGNTGECGSPVLGSIPSPADHRVAPRRHRGLISPAIRDRYPATPPTWPVRLDGSGRRPLKPDTAVRIRHGPPTGGSSAAEQRSDMPPGGGASPPPRTIRP